MTSNEPRADTYGDAYFQSRYSWTPGRDRTWKVIASHLERLIPRHEVVLDLGAGYCAFINAMTASEKHALDLYRGFSKYALAGVHTHVGSCRDLSPFQSGQFDMVFASNLLEHLTREATADVLAEARRILKADGALVLLQPNFFYAYREYFDDPTHIQIFTHRGLADLLAASGFEVTHCESRFMPFSFKSRWPTWTWLVKLYLRLPFRPFAKQMLLVARPARA